MRAGGADFDFPMVDGVPLLFRLLTQGNGWEIANHLHLYRVRPASLSRGNEHLKQAYQVRVKYGPEFIKAEPKAMPEQNFWRFIANLEILSKDVRAIKRAFNQMKQEGRWGTQREASLLAQPCVTTYLPPSRRTTVPPQTRLGRKFPLIACRRRKRFLDQERRTSAKDQSARAEH